MVPKLSRVVRIPTYVHVIKGTHKGERVPAGPKRVRQAISILNNGMRGNQSQYSALSRYQFVLKKIDYRKRDGWHHAFFNGPRDQRMKRAMHVGNETHAQPVHQRRRSQERAGAGLVAVPVAVPRRRPTWTGSR